MARSQATQGTQPGPSGAAAERSPAFRFAFLQILMQRGYMPEADAKALYRRLCSVNSGATGGRAQSWVPQPRRATRPPAWRGVATRAAAARKQASLLAVWFSAPGGHSAASAAYAQLTRPHAALQPPHRSSTAA